jgi:peptidoglycan/xylan/chitin deacetylase (PgdA/CDA1 family)
MARDAIAEPGAAPRDPDEMHGGVRLRGWIRAASLAVAGRILPWPSRPFLRALYFHDVPDHQAVQFERLVRQLADRGRFVDADTLVAMAQGHRPVDGPYFHLSFDDGFRTVLVNAAPVLARLHVPATVFVITGRVASDGGSGAERLGWDELRALQALGIEIGSHTVSHRRLAAIADPIALDVEIAGSKAIIESNLRVECKYIAWPFGGIADVHEPAIAAVARAGYRGCFGGFRGSVNPGVTSAFRIPRHHLDAGWPWSHVRYFASGRWE